jgi:hypothetical protein
LNEGWWWLLWTSHSAWPEEISQLRKLKTLTFEGNDQLKELPFFDRFPELRSLKVCDAHATARTHATTIAARHSRLLLLSSLPRPGDAPSQLSHPG